MRTFALKPGVGSSGEGLRELFAVKSIVLVLHPYPFLPNRFSRLRFLFKTRIFQEKVFCEGLEDTSLDISPPPSESLGKVGNKQ